MNLRKLCLLSFVVLLVCQLGFAQHATILPDNTLASKAIATVQATGKPTPVVPLKSIAGLAAARPTIWISHSLGIKKALHAGEPSFCEQNNGSFYTFCAAGVQTAYSVAQIVGANKGAGTTIAIVDAFAYPGALTQLNQFSSDMTLPTLTSTLPNGSCPSHPCFTSVNLSPFDADGTGWDLESMLDVEYAHAMAPKADIVYVQAYDNSDDGLGQGVNIGAFGCPASIYCGSVLPSPGPSPAADLVSNSWSGGEDSTFDFYWNLGKVLLFASGDDSSWPIQGFVGYPCSADTITCVGGTSLYVNSNLQRTSEVGWAGSGGGCSVEEPIPSWQGNNGSGVCSPTRASPDIAAIADPNTGVAVYISDNYFGTGYYQVGGTSVATPVSAGLYADIDTARVSFGKPKETFLNPGLYLRASQGNYNYFLYDITSGNNGYSAGFQFDLVTGLGNSTGSALANRFYGLP